MFKVYDLTAEEGGFRPFPLSAGHRLNLRTALLEELREVPNANHEILATYSEKPTVWNIPPMYSGNLRRASLQISCDFRQQKSTGYEDYLYMLRLFATKPWSDKFKLELVSRFGEGPASNELLFDNNSEDLAKFAVEYTLAVSRTHKVGALVTGDGTLTLPVASGRDSIDYIGIVNGELQGSSVVVKPYELFEWVMALRGTVTTKVYGVYDRMLLWSESNYGRLKHPDGFQTALGLLKLSQDPAARFDKDEVELEGRLRNQKAVKEETPFTAGKMTYEEFAAARALWVEAVNKPPEEAFLNFFGELVPKVYDSETFKKIFGMLPTADKELSRRQLERIDKGMEKFSVEFLNAGKGKL